MSWEGLHLMRIVVGALALALLGGCSGQTSPDDATSSPSIAADPAATETAVPFEWAGKWIGPEGLYVIIRPLEDSSVELEMQSDLDMLGTYAGSITPEGISFERGGQMLLLKPSSGADTGLKYLSGRTNCLMVQPGEGYCRD